MQDISYFNRIFVTPPTTNPSNQGLFVQLQSKKVGTVGRERFVARYSKIPTQKWKPRRQMAGSCEDGHVE